MGIIDLLIIITTCLSVIFALYRGLVRELLGITAWILASVAGLYSYSVMQPIMGKFIENKVLSGLLGAILIAILVLIVMTLINAGITSKLRNSALSGLDRVLGFIFGLFRAWLFITVVYIGASMICSPQQLTESADHNYTLPYLEQSAQILEHFIPEAIKKDIKSYKQEDIQNIIPEDIGNKVKEEIIEYKEDTRDSLDALIEQMG